MNAALGFEKRMIAQQSLLTAAAFAALAAFAPAVLRIEEALVADVVVRVAGLGIAAAMLVAVWMRVRVRRHRATLRALALGSRAIEPHDIEGLRRIPRSAVTSQLVVGAMATAAAALLRPAPIGNEVARELAMLGVMTALAASVPALVLAQTAIAKLLEVAPLEAVAQHLADLAERGEPARISRKNLTFAVVVPIALVGVAGALASYAHLRAITDESRKAAAYAIGRSVVGGGETRRSEGQKAAGATAKRLGYDVVLTEEEHAEEVVRMEDDRLRLSVPLQTGRVSVTYSAEVGFEASFPHAAVAFGFALIGMVAASVVARLLSRDLTNAAERLRTLGTEAVLAGEDAPAPRARFEVVAELAAAALTLTERFRVFAAAQERALEAKENALRMRGLFFASVSHDLKSPLNAILGFADTIDRDPMTASQRESLDLISTRGRELVALIETILDAARVEAGQLKLSRRPAPVSSWVGGAGRLARELSQDAGDLTVEIAEGLPPAEVDLTHLPRALAVVIAHALRAPTSDGARARVTVRASLPARERRLRIEIDHGNTAITAAELAALFSRQSSARGRGLTLGLSLARSILDLHGGSIEVQGDRGGPPLVHAYLPVAVSIPPPRGSGPSKPPTAGGASRARGSTPGSTSGGPRTT